MGGPLFFWCIGIGSARLAICSQSVLEIDTIEFVDMFLQHIRVVINAMVLGGGFYTISAVETTNGVCPMTTINLDYISTECLIDIANALSKEIDNPAEGYEQYTQHVGKQFGIVCGIIESRGVELSDYVVCPHAEGTWEGPYDSEA